MANQSPSVLCFHELQKIRGLLKNLVNNNDFAWKSTVGDVRDLFNSILQLNKISALKEWVSSLKSVLQSLASYFLKLMIRSVRNCDHKNYTEDEINNDLKLVYDLVGSSDESVVIVAVKSAGILEREGDYQCKIFSLIASKVFEKYVTTRKALIRRRTLLMWIVLLARFWLMFCDDREKTNVWETINSVLPASMTTNGKRVKTKKLLELPVDELAEILECNIPSSEKIPALLLKCKEGSKEYKQLQELLGIIKAVAVKLQAITGKRKAEKRDDCSSKKTLPKSHQWTIESTKCDIHGNTSSATGSEDFIPSSLQHIENNKWKLKRKRSELHKEELAGKMRKRDRFGVRKIQDCSASGQTRYTREMSKEVLKEEKYCETGTDAIHEEDFSLKLESDNENPSPVDDKQEKKDVTSRRAHKNHGKKQPSISMDMTPQKCGGSEEEFQQSKCSEKEKTGKSKSKLSSKKEEGLKEVYGEAMTMSLPKGWLREVHSRIINTKESLRLRLEVFVISADGRKHSCQKNVVRYIKKNFPDSKIDLGTIKSWFKIEPDLREKVLQEKKGLLEELRALKQKEKHYTPLKMKFQSTRFKGKAFGSGLTERKTRTVHSEQGFSELKDRCGNADYKSKGKNVINTLQKYFEKDKEKQEEVKVSSQADPYEFVDETECLDDRKLFQMFSKNVHEVIAEVHQEDTAENITVQEEVQEYNKLERDDLDKSKSSSKDSSAIKDSMPSCKPIDSKDGELPSSTYKPSDMGQGSSLLFLIPEDTKGKLKPGDVIHAKFSKEPSPGNSDNTSKLEPSTSIMAMIKGSTSSSNIPDGVSLDSLMETSLRSCSAELGNGKSSFDQEKNCESNSIKTECDVNQTRENVNSLQLHLDGVLTFKKQCSTPKKVVEEEIESPNVSVVCSSSHKHSKKVQTTPKNINSLMRSINETCLHETNDQETQTLGDSVQQATVLKDRDSGERKALIAVPPKVSGKDILLELKWYKIIPGSFTLLDSCLVSLSQQEIIPPTIMEKQLLDALQMTELERTESESGGRLEQDPKGAQMDTSHFGTPMLNTLIEHLEGSLTSEKTQSTSQTTVGEDNLPREAVAASFVGGIDGSNKGNDSFLPGQEHFLFEDDDERNDTEYFSFAGHINMPERNYKRSLYACHGSPLSKLMENLRILPESSSTNTALSRICIQHQKSEEWQSDNLFHPFLLDLLCPICRLILDDIRPCTFYPELMQLTQDRREEDLPSPLEHMTETTRMVYWEYVENVLSLFPGREALPLPTSWNFVSSCSAHAVKDYKDLVASLSPIPSPVGDSKHSHNPDLSQQSSLDQEQCVKDMNTFRDLTPKDVQQPSGRTESSNESLEGSVPKVSSTTLPGTSKDFNKREAEEMDMQHSHVSTSATAFSVPKIKHKTKQKAKQQKIIYKRLFKSKGKNKKGKKSAGERERTYDKCLKSIMASRFVISPKNELQGIQTAAKIGNDGKATEKVPYTYYTDKLNNGTNTIVVKQKKMQKDLKNMKKGDFIVTDISDKKLAGTEFDALERFKSHQKEALQKVTQKSSFKRKV